MARRGTIRNTARIARELADARRARARQRRKKAEQEQAAATAAPTHHDYAEEAEAAQRAEAWPQAMALWRRAAETCRDPDLAVGYLGSAEACMRRMVDAKLAQIARDFLGMPTLNAREIANYYTIKGPLIKKALQAAYEAGLGMGQTTK